MLHKRSFSYKSLFISTIALFTGFIVQAQTISISPNVSKKGKKIQVTITGNNTNLGNTETCSGNPNCKSIGNEMFFKSGTSTITLHKVQLDSLYYIDNTTAKAYITPSNIGIYNISLANGLASENTFTVEEIPNPNFNIFLTDTIGGNQKIQFVAQYGVFKNENNCFNNNCILLSDTIYQSTGGYTFEKIVLDSLEISDSTTAKAVIKLPRKTGNYFLKTKNGITSNNFIQLNYSRKKEFNVSPTQGVASEKLKVTISGVKTVFGQGSSCKNSDNCLEFGGTIDFSIGSGSSTLHSPVYLESVNSINDSTFQAYITLPSIAGNYTLISSNSGTISNAKFEVKAPIVPVIKQGNLNMYQTKINEEYYSNWGFDEVQQFVLTNQKVKFIITGKYTKSHFGNDSTCSNDEYCAVLNKYLYTQNGDSLKIDSVVIIDDYSRIITITTPSTPGDYTFQTKNEIKINNPILVRNRANKKIDFENKKINVGNKLKVGIVGNDFNFVQGTNCISSSNCLELNKNTLIYFKNLTSNIIDSTKLNLVQSYVNSPNITAVIQFPQTSGNYYFYFADKSIKGDTLSIVPYLTMDKIETHCKGDKIPVNISLKGKSPWELTYSYDNEIYTKSNISDSIFTIILTSSSYGYKTLFFNSISDGNNINNENAIYQNHYFSKCDSTVDDLNIIKTYQSNTLQLSWFEKDTSNVYCIQISKDSLFTNLITDNCNITTNTYYDEQLVNDYFKSNQTQNYFWRVSIKNGIWSDTNRIIVNEITTSISSELESKNSIDIYPNPTTNYFQITNNELVESVNIINQLGLVIKTFKNTNEYSTENITSGYYFLNIITNDGKQIFKKILIK